ncbi:non-ribosomal peptide synthetase, partial [Rhodoplanes sp. TEM]|uniref:non-ribosomal peptide synthetase n=1 Tax=Rhodoplanes sp. TEM TaxID=3025489 RepID=UPI0023503C71
LAYGPSDRAGPRGRRYQGARAAGLRRVLVAANDAAGGPLPGGCAAVPVAVPEATPALPDPSDAAGPDPDPRTPAYVIFTSGSTGQPKGVVVTHAAAWNTIADVTARFGIGPDDRLLGLSPLAFDLSVYDVFGVLGAGATLVLPEPERRRDVGHWIELMVRHRVTVWNSVPALLDLVLRAGHAGYAAAAGLRTVLLSGDWIPLDLVRRFRAIAPQAALHGLGGATEAAIWSIAHPILGAEEGWTSVPYGLPLANQRWHVLDARLDPCPDWVAGDLHIAGDGLALGYLDDPQRTAAAFFRHPRTGERLYHTGDRGRYRPGGVIEFLGRRDGQVKIGGQRIELGEIEAVLEQHPAVRRAVVVAAGEGSARRPVAYVVPERAADAGRLAPETPAQETLAQEILAHVEARLPRVMVPAAVIPIAAVPLTRNGKVDRAALPAPDCTAESHVAPATALERSLAALVAAELKVERVGVTTRLAELGVTSIHLVALHQAIGRELETAVPLAALLGAATVRDLAAAIAAGGDAAAPVAATADGALAARRQARRHAAERRPPGARVD